jgi:hypothetical protein
MMSGAFLVSGKDALELAVKGDRNNVLAVSELGKSLLGLPHRAGENRGLHDPLKAILPNRLSNVKQAVPKFNLRGLFDKKASFQAARHFTRLSTDKSSELAQVPLSEVNPALQQPKRAGFIPFSAQQGCSRRCPNDSESSPRFLAKHNGELLSTALET